MTTINFDVLNDYTGKPIIAAKFSDLDTAKNQIDAMLQARNIKFSVVLVGATLRDGWVCDAWRVSFDKFAADYFTGTGHRKPTNPRKPVDSHWNPLRAISPCAADVLYSLLLDSEACNESYQDWCDNFGYESDSIKALNTYRACEAIGHELRKAFDHKTREAFSAVLQGY